jgi:hypothetical protein
MTLKSPLYLQTSIFPSITWSEDSKGDFSIESLTPKGYLMFFDKIALGTKHQQSSDLRFAHFQAFEELFEKRSIGN